jgi:hypothetical protein
LSTRLAHLPAIEVAGLTATEEAVVPAEEGREDIRLLLIHFRVRCKICADKNAKRNMN